MDQHEYVKVTVIVEDSTHRKTIMFDKVHSPRLNTDYDPITGFMDEVSVEFHALPDEHNLYYTSIEAEL